MASFKTYLDQHEFVEKVLLEFQTPQKAQSMKRPQILQMWKNLRPDMPIRIIPLADAVPGKNRRTYGQDGIRISGSWEFIASVIGRLKEMLAYENPQTKLRLSFRTVNDENGLGRKSYTFYINLERRDEKPRNKGII